MMEPFYRFRNAFWAICYSALHTYFGIKRGVLFIPEKLVQQGTVKHGVRCIPMKRHL